MLCAIWIRATKNEGWSWGEKLGVWDWIFFLGSDTKGSVECVFFRSDVRGLTLMLSVSLYCDILQCAICILRCNMNNFLLNHKGLVRMSMRVNPNNECSLGSVECVFLWSDTKGVVECVWPGLLIWTWSFCFILRSAISVQYAAYCNAIWILFF